jgi:hypothetical protein
LKSNLPKEPESSFNTSPTLAIAPGSATCTHIERASFTEPEEFVILGHTRMAAWIAVGFIAMVAVEYQEKKAKPAPIGSA